MLKGDIFNKLANKLRVTANIVIIVFPLLCWALVVLRWCDIWLTAPLMLGVTIFYYILAAAYLFFTFITHRRIISLIGLLLVLTAFIFLWIPYKWVLVILLAPLVCIVLSNRDSKVVVTILAVLLAISVLFVISNVLLFGGLTPEKYTYYVSPDGSYVALEYAFTTIPGGTDVILCRVNGSLLVKERVLYLANYSDFGGKIEWLDQSTILIYGEKMDVFKDPVLERYVPF